MSDPRGFLNFTRRGGARRPVSERLGDYREFEIAPMIRKMCKETGLSLRQIYELFPSGPAKGACKVAGLPKPTGCV